LGEVESVDGVRDFEEPGRDRAILHAHGDGRAGDTVAKHVGVEHCHDLGALRQDLLCVGVRAKESLLLAGEEDKADRVHKRRVERGDDTGELNDGRAAAAVSSAPGARPVLSLTLVLRES